jgi:hypothetical protein
MNTLLYISFGSGRHQVEMAYALATLGRFSKKQCVGDDGRIVLLTDTPEQFRDYSPLIEIVEVAPARVAEWVGHRDFFFRSRIQAMRWWLANHDGKLLAVDGDTYFETAPSRLFNVIAPGRTVMYEPECAFADAAIPDYQRIAEVLDSVHRLSLGDGRFVPCGARTMQWNAGVLGICKENASLLDDVLTVLDALHPLLGSLWSLEQTAFSIVWGAMSEIYPAYRSIFHYNAHPERVRFDQEIPGLLQSSATLSLAERAKQLYGRRLQRTLRQGIKHFQKRVLVACGMWDNVMRLKAGVGHRGGRSATSAT